MFSANVFINTGSDAFHLVKITVNFVCLWTYGEVEFEENNIM